MKIPRNSSEAKRTNSPRPNLDKILDLVNEAIALLEEGILKDDSQSEDVQ